MFKIGLIIICLMNVRISGQPDPVVTPSNTAIVAGQRTQLECRIKSGQIRSWKFRPYSKENDLPIFSNWMQVPNFTVMRDGFGLAADNSGSGFLYTNFTKLEDAGVYTCETQARNAAPVSKFSAHLIVLESEPVCEMILRETSTNRQTSEERIWLQCLVNFSGNWIPSFRWNRHISEAVVEQIANHSIVVKNTTLHSSVSSTVVVESPINASFLTCEIYFELEENHRVQVSATNIPKYKYTWIWRQLQVSQKASALAPVETSTRGSTKKHEKHHEHGNKAVWATMTTTMIVLLSLIVLMIIACFACCCFFKKPISECMLRFLAAPQTELPKEPDVIRQNRTAPAQNVGLHVQLRPKASQRQSGTAVEAADDSTYSMLGEEPPIYSSLRRNIEPPSCSSLYADNQQQ